MSNDINANTHGFKNKALEIFVTSPELPYENGEEQEPNKNGYQHTSLCSFGRSWPLFVGLLSQSLLLLN